MNSPLLASEPSQSLDAESPNVAARRSDSIDISSDRRPSFSVLVKTELRKMRDTRSGVALISVIVGSMIAIPIFLLILVATGSRFVFSDFAAAAEVGARLLVPVLVVLLVTSEWSQRSAMSTFALVPDRGRVLSAKFAAALGATLTAFVAVITVAAAANLTSGLFGNGPVTWDTSWTALGTDGLGYLFDSLLAFALATALLSSAAGLVAYFIIQLAVPAMLFGASMVDSLRPIVVWIDPGAIVEVDFEPTVGSNWAHLAVASLVWIGIPLAVGVRRVLTTEIK